MKSRVAHAVVVLSALTFCIGCQTLRNTPQQDYVFALGENCRTSQFAVVWVSRDGKQWRSNTGDAGNELQLIQQCMREQFRTHSYEAWLIQQGRLRSGATATLPTPGSGGAAVTAPPMKEVAAPRWNIGDEWAYRYEGVAGSGTFLWSVARSESMDGHDCYVIKVGSREIFYRKSDLASMRETVDGVVVRRDVPPRTFYRWPLAAGMKWDLAFTMENWRDRQTTENLYSWEVTGTEQVTVPAGTFETFKIVSRNMKTNRPVYEMWYAPAARQWVKIHEYLESGERTREMIGYKIQ